jgi:hypothetical protein
MRNIGWERYCFVFRPALCRGKRYGPNIVLGTAKRPHLALCCVQLLSEGRFIYQNSRACSLPHLFIAVSHVFSPTPFRLALLRHTYSYRTFICFISKILCSEAGSIARGTSSIFETHASEFVSLTMNKLLVNILCREDFDILLLSIS